ncbi:MAG: hypothetical protein M3070_08680 [Actinomycetota bacterium]|nr:hypothetical protein [Actinomycetota bacterium]
MSDAAARTVGPDPVLPDCVPAVAVAPAPLDVADELEDVVVLLVPQPAASSDAPTTSATRWVNRRLTDVETSTGQ